MKISGSSAEDKTQHPAYTATSTNAGIMEATEDKELSLRKWTSLSVTCCLECVLIFSAANAKATPVQSTANQSTRDGQHDFDFDFGTWKTHSSRLVHPLSGSKDWVEMDGLTVVSNVWNGRANLAEYKANGPSSHVELLAVRYYNPEAHQWSVAFATPNIGRLSVPCIGEFKDGRGEFFDQEEFNGKYIMVRFSIWKVSGNTAQSEQAFSDDGGKTWETNWINK